VYWTYGTRPPFLLFPLFAFVALAVKFLLFSSPVRVPVPRGVHGCQSPFWGKGQRGIGHPLNKIIRKHKKSLDKALSCPAFTLQGIL
jgi:hypothetical protein